MVIIQFLIMRTYGVVDTSSQSLKIFCMPELEHVIEAFVQTALKKQDSPNVHCNNHQMVKKVHYLTVPT